MTDIEWFKFEKKDLDFPFYRKNPYVSKVRWILLFIALIFGTVISGLSNLSSGWKGVLLGLIACIILIVPILYFLNWDYKALFQKPSRNDILLAIGLFKGYMIYSISMAIILEQVGISSPGTVETAGATIMNIPPIFFSLMGEEFVKIIPFLFFMRLIYKFTENRKASIVVAMILVMLFFASLHAFTWTMLIFAILIQGIGSIFEFYGYIKTKNILISYLTHLCTDIFIWIVVLSGTAKKQNLIKKR